MIVLEGLPCAGKTTIAKWLSRELSTIFIPELFDEKLKKDKRRINFYINDLIKGSNHLDDNIVIDRYFISTIAFEETIKVLKKKRLISEHNLGLYDFRNFHAKQLYAFLLKYSVIRQPNVVFYLKISATDSIKRQYREKRGFSKLKDEFNIWQIPQFLKEYQNFCLKNLKKYYSINPIIININGRLTLSNIYTIISYKLKQCKMV